MPHQEGFGCEEAAKGKHAAMKGDHVVEVKPGEEVVSVNVGWTVEKFVEEEEKEAPKKSVRAKATVKKTSSKAKAKPRKKANKKK